MTSQSEQFGSLLKRLRIAAALSHEALAERSGVSVRAISDLEQGHRQAPRLETVRLLAEGLGLPDADRVALLHASRSEISHGGVPDLDEETTVAGVDLNEGRPEDAARLVGVVDAAREAQGLGRYRHPLHSRQIIDSIKEKLGDDDFQTFSGEGRGIPFETIMKKVLTLADIA